MYDPVRIALVGDYPGELVGDTEAPLRLGEEHYTAIRRDPSAIERGTHLLARYRWQVKGQRDIVIHQNSLLLDRYALAASINYDAHSVSAHAAGPSAPKK